MLLASYNPSSVNAIELLLVFILVSVAVGSIVWFVDKKSFSSWVISSPNISSIVVSVISVVFVSGKSKLGIPLLFNILLTIKSQQLLL